MNPIVIGSLYGTALGMALCLSIACACRLYKRDKQNPPFPVKLSDSRDEKILASATKYIKVICRD